MQVITSTEEGGFASLLRWSLILEHSKELGGLYLGNHHNAQDPEFLEPENITAILDVAGFDRQYSKEISYKSVPAFDYEGFNMSVFFEECFEFIHEHRTQGRNVFVHCQAGMSRSPTIVIGYLLKNEGMDYQTAFEFVKKRRARIGPNKGFRTQLMNYYEALKDKKKELINCKEESIVSDEVNNKEEIPQ
jgi:dual specificity MAP kinase phosphatase